MKRKVRERKKNYKRGELATETATSFLQFLPISGRGRLPEPKQAQSWKLDIFFPSSSGKSLPEKNIPLWRFPPLNAD